MLKETAKIIAKTGSDGETSFEAVPSSVADQLNGTTVDDGKGNKSYIKNTGKTVTTINEETENELQPEDIMNMAKQLGKGVAVALRAHGDNLARVSVKEYSQNGCTVKVVYKPDEEGNEWEDEFVFLFRNGKVILSNDKLKLDVCPITQQSGSIMLNGDLIKSVVTKFIDKETLVKEQEGCIKGFSEALKAYKQGKTKATVKELLKQARNFEGDTLQGKFQDAVNMYRMYNNPSGEEEPCGDACCEGSTLNIGYSLFIRLLEYAREDSKEDKDLHFIAEKVDQLTREKGCATMDDYDDVISKSTQPGPKQPMDETDVKDVIAKVKEGWEQGKRTVVCKTRDGQTVSKTVDNLEDAHRFAIQSAFTGGNFVEMTECLAEATDKTQNKINRLKTRVEKFIQKLEDCYKTVEDRTLPSVDSTWMTQDNVEYNVEDLDNGGFIVHRVETSTLSPSGRRPDVFRDDFKVEPIQEDGELFITNSDSYDELWQQISEDNRRISKALRVWHSDNPDAELEKDNDEEGV